MQPSVYVKENTVVSFDLHGSFDIMTFDHPLCFLYYSHFFLVLVSLEMYRIFTLQEMILKFTLYRVFGSTKNE